MRDAWKWPSWWVGYVGHAVFVCLVVGRRDEQERKGSLARSGSAKPKRSAGYPADHLIRASALGHLAAKRYYAAAQTKIMQYAMLDGDDVCCTYDALWLPVRESPSPNASCLFFLFLLGFGKQLVASGPSVDVAEHGELSDDEQV